MTTDFSTTLVSRSQFWQVPSQGHLLPLDPTNQDDCDLVLEIPGSFSGSRLHFSEGMQQQRAAFSQRTVEHLPEGCTWQDWLFWIDSLHQGAPEEPVPFPLQAFQIFLARRPPPEILHFFIEKAVSAYYAAWTDPERQQFLSLLERFFPEGGFLFVKSSELIQQIFEAAPEYLVDYFFVLAGADHVGRETLKNSLVRAVKYSQKDAKKRALVKYLAGSPIVEAVLRENREFDEYFFKIQSENALTSLFRLHTTLPLRFPIDKLAREGLLKFSQCRRGLEREERELGDMRAAAIDMVQQFCTEESAYRDAATKMLLQLWVLEASSMQDLAPSFWEICSHEVLPSSEEEFGVVVKDQERDSRSRIICQMRSPRSGLSSQFTLGLCKKSRELAEKVKDGEFQNASLVLKEEFQESFLFMCLFFRGLRISVSYFFSNLEEILNCCSERGMFLDFLIEKLIRYYYHHWTNEERQLFFTYLSRLPRPLNFLISISLVARICEVAYQPLLSFALVFLENSREEDTKCFIENILRWLVLATKDQQRAFLKDLSELPDLQALISQDPDFSKFIEWAAQERDFIAALVARDPDAPFVVSDWILQMPYQGLSQQVEFLSFLVSGKISEWTEVLLAALFCQGAPLTVLEHPLPMLQRGDPEILDRPKKKRKKSTKKAKAMPEAQPSPEEVISEIINFIASKRGKFNTRLEKFLSLHQPLYLECCQVHSHLAQTLYDLSLQLLAGMRDKQDESQKGPLQQFRKVLKKTLSKETEPSSSEASGSGVREAGLFSTSTSQLFVLRDSLISQVLSVLKESGSGQETLLVGGVLRNLVQNSEAQVFRDIDMVTELSEEGLMQRLSTLKTQLESKSPEGKLEFQVSKRIDSLMTMKWFTSKEDPSQSIHFDISFGRNLQDLCADACSRDYTMNAMYGCYHESEAEGSAMIQLLTPLASSDRHAQEKLLIPAGGDLRKALEEDPARVLRSIGFLASGYRFASADDEEIFREVAVGCFLQQERDAGIFQLKQLFLNPALKRAEIWGQLAVWDIYASHKEQLLQGTDFSRLSPRTLQYTLEQLWERIRERREVHRQSNGLVPI